MIVFVLYHQEYMRRQGVPTSIRRKITSHFHKAFT